MRPEAMQPSDFNNKTSPQIPDTFYKLIQPNNPGPTIKISRLGLGTVKLGRNTGVKYPTSFQIPNDTEAANLLSTSKELGINLLDTAPAYGNSEQRLGTLLKPYPRDAWLIASKAGEIFNSSNGTSHYDFRRQAIISSVQQSLTNLKTDYIDMLLIHSNGDDVAIINNYEVFNTLEYLKQQGYIRFFGMSTKTVAGGLLTVQHADVAMVTFNPGNVADLPVIQAAAQNNKIILVKKAFDSGHLVNNTTGNNSVNNTVKFILKEPGVTSIVSGTISIKHLQQNAAATVAAAMIND
jgi:aryl-alcohol dehydrogenase-like predicted oxidoreductase